ncbi:MAG: MaoC family dehydratase N-terminal domain-containing protein [Actinomycetota bacterium]|nr:MaoC family dehydratase N-terminal domain-containing protein [Actinomycetota bacterium]
MTVTPERWGVIDEESIQEARELLGVPLRRDRMQWNDYATQDAIRQFADGVGDKNPLWRDSDYASKTRWASLLAPPSFL